MILRAPEAGKPPAASGFLRLLIVMCLCAMTVTNAALEVSAALPHPQLDIPYTVETSLYNISLLCVVSDLSLLFGNSWHFHMHVDYGPFGPCGLGGQGDCTLRLNSLPLLLCM